MGSHGEFFTCNARQAVRLSEKVDPAIALLAEPLAVSLHAINRMNRKKMRSWQSWARNDRLH